MNNLLASPLRNLAAGIIYMLTLSALAVLGYHLLGWPLGDALYMVVITVFTVGYGEVREVSTPELRALTMTLIVLGCTGMIFVTASLVQMITVSQFQTLFGSLRMRKDIDALRNHIVICGFGRLGQTLARDLHAASVPFVVIERDEPRIQAAREGGYLCQAGDATDEAALLAAGIMRARALATVLADDASNVFITLSARALCPELVIIARGELPSTEKKLLRAGANRVVLPTHIGAERIAEMLLFQDIAESVGTKGNHSAVNRSLKHLGLEVEMVPVAESSQAVGGSVGDAERHGEGSFLIVALHRHDGQTLVQPAAEEQLKPGDAVAIIGRPARAQRVREIFG
jgi:voltage-gated potassium channel Kch